MTFYEYLIVYFSYICDIISVVYISATLSGRYACALYIFVYCILSYQQIIGIKHS